MKFAHFSDVHLGGWKDPKMTRLGQETFETAVRICLERKVDFIIIAGDLFNTAIPNIDIIKEAARVLKTVKDANVPIYAIPGSHDFSAAGKTMLDVLERSGLLINVMKQDENGHLQFTIDERTGAKLTGFYGKKGGLEKFELQELRKDHLENETGFKIFLFHTGVYEFMPTNLKEKMESSPRNFLPKNFNYYAGGHIHYVFKHVEANSITAFPGALYPNSFSELEEYKCGGMYIVDDQLNCEHIQMPLREVVSVHYDATNKTCLEVEQDLLALKEDVANKILMLRITGILASGKAGDINFNRIFERYEHAYAVLKNTTGLTSSEATLIDVPQKNIEEIETDILASAEKTSSLTDQEHLATMLMQALNTDRMDGEKVQSFEDRIIKESNTVFDFEP